jgi:hypothetical protein
MAYQNRRGQRNDRNNNEVEINNIISKINGLEKLCDMSVKDFADVDGYADIVAKNSKTAKDKSIKEILRSSTFNGTKRNMGRN